VKRFSLAVLPGDGIGPEVTAEAVKVLHAAADLFGYRIDTSEYAVGAAGVGESGDSLPERTRAAVVEAEAVLLGAVGHPDLASAEGKRRPEAGLLALRKLLGVYANLRPVVVHPSLVHASPLRPERLAGVDLLIVRELTGGLYYGEPRVLERDSAVNTLRYTAGEIERVARVAFRAAAERRGLLTSVDKANVLEVSELWRETVTRVARAPVRGFRRDAAGGGARPGGRAADREPVRRYPERRSGGAHGLAGPAALGVAG
jgi:3-isopropylmalate dehydrogenase